MFIRTDRLFLRPAWIEDAPELARALGDKMVVRNLSRVPWPYTEQDAREWIARERDPFLPTLLVTLPDVGGKIVGASGLHEDGDDLAFGYWIARGYHGRGYATEAGQSMISLARTLGHRRLRADHFADNPASGRVLRKLGFTQTGKTLARKSLGRGGASVPAVSYELDLASAEEPQDSAFMPKAA
ncbi:MAG: GNAT family N-acetyltransferase [Acetobacteraceae bacterium]|nr:GNAT family N-acetyltransferase [Acetobacteraceae bacterium]